MTQEIGSNAPSADEGPAYRRRKAQRPDEIVQAGMEEFLDHGFAGASLNRIASRAGISRAALYLYFDNKEALFDAVTERALGDFLSEAAAQIDDFSGSTEDLLRKFLTNYYATVATTRNSVVMRIIMTESARFPQLAERYQDVVLSQFHGILNKIIRRGIDAGELSEGPETSMPRLIMAPAIFYMLSRMIFKRADKIDPAEYIEAHLSLVLNGIRKR